MAEPFQLRAGNGAGDCPPKSACRDQIEQLLAAAERVRNVSAREVAEVGARHGLNLGRQLGAARRELYRRFLEHCLLDFRFTPDESSDVLHLKQILHLEAWEAAEIHDEVVRRVYGRALETVLEDEQLDPDEEVFIRRLREDLEIPLVAAEGMLQQAWREARKRGATRGSTSGGPREAEPRKPISLAGSSETSVEDAIRHAVARTPGAGDVERVALVHLEVELRNGEPSLFHVRLEEAGPP